MSRVAMLRVSWLLAAGLVLHVRASALHAPTQSLILSSPASPLLSRRARAIVLVSTPEEAEAVEDDEASIDGDDDNPFSSRPRTVDPMKTSLGRERELMPFAGPPIVTFDEPPEDPRPLFAHMGLFTEAHMPSDALQASYHEWLAVDSGERICLPHYLLSAQDFTLEMETTGDVLTDDEIARLDAEEEQAATQEAVLDSEGATGAPDPVVGATSDLNLEQPPSDASTSVEFASAADPLKASAAEPSAASMTPAHVQFVLGHLTVGRHPSWADAEAWAASDPIAQQGGYGRGHHVHQWLRSHEEALRVMPTAEVEQCFAVHCLDHPGSTELRARTRDAHLDWLRASGRVWM